MIKQFTFKFSGRLGNNIVSIFNALHIHRCNKNSLLLIPKSRYITKQIIDYHSILSNNKKRSEPEDYLFLNKNNYFPKNIDTNIQKVYIPNIYYWKKNQSMCNTTYIKFAERISTKDIVCDNILGLTKPKNPIGNNDLLIHIRSTDIHKNDPHKAYAQPPIAFYQKVIQDNNFENIYVISDDNTNFVIRSLIEKYPNAHIVNEKDVKKAFNLIRYAKNICTSMSSFCTMASFCKPICLLEKNIFTFEYLCYKPGVWHFSYMFDETLKRDGYNFHIYRFIDYPFMIKQNDIFISNWSFTEDTKKIMINYPISNIEKIKDHEYR